MTTKLTDKQLVFIERYLTTWNATQAAIDAGYSAKTARVTGPENLSKPAIQAAIAERLAELKMSADEVLVRLSEHARGSIAPFMRISPDGELHGFDLSDDRPLNLLHKVTITKRTVKELTEEKVSIELYDAQAALALIGKHHGLFVEKIDISHQEIEKFLDTLKNNLSEDEYARIVALAAGAETPRG